MSAVVVTSPEELRGLVREGVREAWTELFPPDLFSPRPMSELGRGEPVVYFIQAGDSGLIKIGTTRNVTARLVALATGSAQPLRLLGCVRGSYSTESELHRRFSGLRALGEWFRPGDELLAFIASDAHK